MPNFSIKHHKFTLRWAPLLLTLVLSSILLSLGFWQLDRAAQKRALLADYEARGHAKPLTITDIDKHNKDLRYYHVQLTGHYDNEHSFLLDNKIYNHQVGYEVLTPFILAISNKSVLINRGWIPQGASRMQLPVISPVRGTKNVQGIIYVPAAKTFTLKQPVVANTHWPQVIQAIDMQTFATILPQNSYPFVVLLDAKSTNGFIRDWQPVSMPAYKNVGYAVQWFALAATLIVIFIIVSLKKK